MRSLRASEVRQAYPLIQLIVPCLPLEEWIRHAEALSTGGHGGIVSAHGEDGYIYGLLCYRITRELGRGRALVVEHLVALDMFDRPTTIQTLISAVERIARDHQCAQVQLALSGARIKLGKIEGSLHGSFGGAGYEVDSVRLCKRLTSEWHIGELLHEIQPKRPAWFACMVRSQFGRSVSTNRGAVRSGCSTGLCDESRVGQEAPTPTHYAAATGEVESVLRKAGGVICQEPMTEVSLKPRPATVPSAPIRAARS